MCPGSTWPIWWMSTHAHGQLLQVLWSMQHFYLLLQLHLQSSIHHQSITMPSVNRCLFLCMYHVHVMFVPFIWCQHQNDSRLTASRCSFQSRIKYHLPKAALSHSAFFFPSSSWMEEDRKEKKTVEKRKRKGHEWWMLCVCLSFPITELCLLKRRCISHFCLSDWWRAGSDWGAVCFKHCFTSHSAFTSVTKHRIGHSHSAMHSPLCNFPDLYLFSCSVLICAVSPVSGLLVQRQKIRSCKLQEYTREECLELNFHTGAHNTYCWHLLDLIYSISLKLISIMFISSKHFWCITAHDITEKLWRVSKLRGGFDWYRFAYQGKLKSPVR